MSRELIKKGLYKFLNDNLDYYVTYDSNNSNLKDINDLLVNVDYIYTHPIPISEIIVYALGVKFTTTENIIGRSFIVYEADSDIIKGQDIITGIDAITGAIELETGFTFDILPENKITILQENLIYLKSQFSLISNDTRFHDLGHNDRIDLILKIRNDSNKDKIETMLQDIRNLFFNNYCNFKIYNDLNVQIGNGKIKSKSYEEIPLMDMSNDVQSFLVTFTAEYFGKYKI